MVFYSTLEKFLEELSTKAHYGRLQTYMHLHGRKELALLAPGRRPEDLRQTHN